jgi:hypothetical protein
LAEVSEVNAHRRCSESAELSQADPDVHLVVDQLVNRPGKELLDGTLSAIAADAPGAEFRRPEHTGEKLETPASVIEHGNDPICRPVGVAADHGCAIPVVRPQPGMILYKDPLDPVGVPVDRFAQVRSVFESGPDAGLTSVYQTLWRCRSESPSDSAANGCGGVCHPAGGL